MRISTISISSVMLETKLFENPKTHLMAFAFDYELVGLKQTIPHMNFYKGEIVKNFDLCDV